MTRTLGKMLPLLVEAATKIFIGPIDSQANKCRVQHPEKWKQDRKIHDLSLFPEEALAINEQVEGSMKTVHAEISLNPTPSFCLFL
jgi:hypothetical protein